MSNSLTEVLAFGLSSNRGGIETYLLKIASHIDKSKFHLNFIDMTGDGNKPYFYDELLGLGCTFYKICPRNVSYMGNRRDVHNLFSKNQFDIFHFNVNTLSYLLPVTEAIKSGCKVLVHSRSTNSPGTSRLTKSLHAFNKSRLKRLPVTRIAVSKAAGEWLYGNSKFDVYHNGVATDQFVYSENNRKAIRRELHCENKTVIAHVGAFLPAKNHRFMISTFEAYANHNPNAVLWLIGDGPMKAEIEAMVNDKGLSAKVMFLGIRENMCELYAGMDLFWFPSLYEGFGNVLLEAQCEGIPCLVSNNVPEDACVARNTFRLSLDAPMNDWVTTMDKAIGFRFEDQSENLSILEKNGLTLQSEITRIETLYQKMLSQ